MVALLDEDGARREGDRYFSYGMPFGLPRADCNADGIVDATDASIISAANGYSVGNVNYDVRADLDLDGTVDSTDAAIQTADNGQTLGLGNLSRDPTLSGGVGNRIGYAGYQWDPSADKYNVRNRVLDPLTGRWMRRDPLGYVDDASLYQYVGSSPIVFVDQDGQVAWIPIACTACAICYAIHASACSESCQYDPNYWGCVGSCVLNGPCSYICIPCTVSRIFTLIRVGRRGWYLAQLWVLAVA